MYCVRVSLWTVKIFLAQHYKKGSCVISVYLCMKLIPANKKKNVKYLIGSVPAGTGSLAECKKEENHSPCDHTQKYR
jgi:hypothetical protein